MADWEGAGPPILALHGATSTHHVWGRLADDIEERRIVAPDLRGRGGSLAMGHPFGLPSHARDLQRLLQEMDLGDVLLVGHSLGAFIAPLLARLEPGRITRMVLLDGGPPVQLPFFMTKPVVRMTFQRQANDISRPIATVEDLVHGRFGPMLKGHPEAQREVAGWLAASLIGREGAWHLPIDPAALPDDAVSSFFDPEVREAGSHPAVPAHLVYPSWGAKDGDRPLYSPKAAKALEASIPNLRTTLAKGANHLTLLFRPEVVAAVNG